MLTQLVHIGDFHAHPDARNAARYAALDQIIAEGRQLPNLGAWLWPGDLFHARSTIEDRNAIAERLIAMGSVAPVVICYGNHDLPGDLDVFAKLKTARPIAVVSVPQCLSVRLATGDMATIFVLPYPTKAGLTAMGIAKPDVLDAAADALEAIFRIAAAGLQEARDRGDLTLMIGHVNVGGSITSVGQPNIGREIEISGRHLDLLGPIYKGLNHIHKAQDIAGADYPGSVCRLNWGEVEEKGYIVVTLDKPCQDVPDGYRVERCPIDVAPMFHVEGVLTRDAFTWQVTAGPGGEVLAAPASWKGCEVRVRFRFNQSEKGTLAEARVYAEFAEAARLEVEPIAVPDRALRAPEVAQAKTLADKVEAWATVSAVTLNDGVLEKLALLEHSDTLTVLKDVQASIDAGDVIEKATVAA